MAYHLPSHMNFNSQAEIEVCLKEILSFVKPTPDDILKRQNVINEIAAALRTDQSLTGAAVKPFGSYISNLYTRWGDLDISIDLTQTKLLPAGRRLKIKALMQIMLALQRTGVANNVVFIRSARIPLVVYQSKYYNISCDISIDNHAGYLKSYILSWINTIDERFCELVLLIKEWAKAQHINDPKAGTLNSYSLSLLVIFHFQTCRPAIFPSLNELFVADIVNIMKGHNTLMHLKDAFDAKIARYKSRIFLQRNQSSLCELLTSFFDKFSGLESLASNHVISTYTGKWEPINGNMRYTRKVQHLLIEDPFDRTDNSARSVGARGLTEIARAFTDMCRKFSSYSVPKDRTFLLNNLLRPEIRSKLDAGRQPIDNQSHPMADWIWQPRPYSSSPASSQTPSTYRY